MQLLKFGFAEDSLCSFCRREVETYEYVFLDCNNVKDVWRGVITHFYLIEIKNIEWKDMFVGFSGNSIRIKFINSLIIMLKYMIYKSRLKGTLPSPNVLKKTLFKYMDEERKLASKRGKLGAHLLKWEYFKGEV